MLFRRPCYYDEFQCKAERCTDNCCIGWEICIDEATAEIYQSIKGDFGKRLKENIDFSSEPSFILNGERCPFLNEKNLCDIIINCGKESLCQICRDHPRYFEWYGSTKEGGIGLSCEEGARLILSEACYADYYESEVDEEPDIDFDQKLFDTLFSLREQIFDILSDQSLPVEMRFCEILSLAEGIQLILDGTPPTPHPFALSFEDTLKNAIPLLGQAEPIDEKWEGEFFSLKENADKLRLIPDKKEEKYLERLFAYFIWRYFLKGVFDRQVKDKISFAVFSVTVIFALYKNQKEQSFEALLRSAVLYSKQMEYSEENLELFFDSQ